MICRQFVCYAAIGLGLNAALYGAYLLLTYGGMSSLAAMTLTYAAGVCCGFLLNRKLTFRYQGGDSGALLRYVASYGIGYALNFVILWLLAVRAGMSHQIVQGCITVGLPVLLFVLQKFWVFRTASSNSTSLLVRPLS